jgi:2',3'-cyclic-nucleotide 2'-phosphodiesterase (5'-nucleotidase family)
VLLDSEGVYHLQGGGDNDGISHAKLYVNTVTDSVEVEKAEYVPTSRYASLQDDPIVAELLEKYSAEISMAGQVLGDNSRYRSSTVIRKLVAQLYYEKGMEVWGEEYDIALGGGFISVRSPYALEAGQVIYGNLVDILPFNNPIVLCRISGKKLKDKFFESTNSNYYIHYGEYGEALKDNINLATAYYVVTDTYTLQYTANGLTEVARLDETTYARDLVAEYIKKGGFA